MSALAKTSAGAAGAAGAGTWFFLAGWPAVVAILAMLGTGAAVVCWVLGSEQRTSRLMSLITAVRLLRR